MDEGGGYWGRISFTEALLAYTYIYTLAHILKLAHTYTQVFTY